MPRELAQLHVGERRFEVADQLSFGLLSGDTNPMHVDPIAARRTQAGGLVVHGVHAFLWALEELVSAGFATRRIAAISVEFRKFLYVLSNVTLSVVRIEADGLRAELTVDGLRTAYLRITFGDELQGQPARSSYEAVPERSIPNVLRIDELGDRSGRLDECTAQKVASAFPQAATAFGARRIGAIIRLSTLVGMVCPGLYSTFSGFDIRLEAGSSDARGVCFTVRNVDERFRLVEMDVRGSGICGTVSAFVRQPPVAQPKLPDLRKVVQASEFADTTALIIGGSRGLGALCASTIAAGGGRVMITYVVGEHDARELAKEIGSSCSVLRYDATEDPAPQLALSEWQPNQVYYFATDQIYRQRANWYDKDRFASFCRIYLDGFEALCSTIMTRDEAALKAFYPSTVYVEERPRDFAEYSMAKAAGEILCAEMNRSIPKLSVLVKRLPRLLTDQTATIVPGTFENPIDILVQIVREMHVG